MSEVLMQNAVRLHQAGRLAEAAQLYQQVLRSNPRHGGALYSLGFAYLQVSQYEEAQGLFAEASGVNPRDTEPWFYRGCALYRLGRHDDAIACFDRTLALKPDYVEALVNRAVARLETGHPAQALVGCDTALCFRPDFLPALVNRGNALTALKRFEEALGCYDRAFELQPDDPAIRDNRDNALFELGRLTRCPPSYMRQLFDKFSSTYDKRMLDELGYRAHAHLRKLSGRVMPDAKPPLRILDLGSGTGLVGEAFKDLARGGRLDGVDLAPLMIEAAKRRGIYDTLVLADLETHLAAPGPIYDLMLAADTMIYLGDLAPTFSGVARRLSPGGFYLFAVEAKEGEGWEQTVNHRFRHSLAYLRNEAARFGLDFVDAMECTLRTEADMPVPGYAVALKKNT